MFHNKLQKRNISNLMSVRPLLSPKEATRRRKRFFMKSTIRRQAQEFCNHQNLTKITGT